MTDFMKINFKLLIPTEEKKRELFLKLKPGEIVTAKVSDVGEKGKVLLNIKGTEVLAETTRGLKKGDIISVVVQGNDNNKIFVKIADKSEISVATETIKKTNEKSGEKLEEIKNIVRDTAFNQKIFISDEKIGRVVDKYIEIRNKQSEESKEMTKGTEKRDIASQLSENIREDKNTLRALVLMEKFDIPLNEKPLNILKEYFNKGGIELSNIDDGISETLKESLAKVKDGETSGEKGIQLVNGLNILDEKKQIDFQFAFGNNEHAEIRINYDEKTEKQEKIDPKNFTLGIKLNLEHIGEIVVRTAVWDNHMGVTFAAPDREKVKVIMEKSQELMHRLNVLGYKIDEIKGRVEKKEEEIQIKGVNIEV